MLDLNGLNPAQKEAVLHGDGPCCVVAGAGSGKTRVLIYRIARLIEDGVPANSILAVTFTRKAAGEMQERLYQLIGAAAEDVNMGTFHSICYRILREEWKVPYEPVQESWQKRVVRKILAPPGKDNPYGMNWDLDVNHALGWISWQKNNLITWRDNLERTVTPEKHRELYRLYEQIKEQERKLDFDDMLLWCYQILQNPAIRKKWAGRFRYILVDEYQDTNVAQNAILKLLAHPHNNVFVVGDARQAIYEWRAARPEFILNFEKVWPGARIIILDINYRSTDNIVRFSNQLIQKAALKYPGLCQANREAAEDPIIMYAEDEDEEAQQIAEEIKTLVTDQTDGDAKYKYGDIAILFRTNAQARAIEDALIKTQIPYVVYGATGFYQRKEVKDILAYLRIALDPYDEEAIARVINVPSRFLGKAFLQKAQEYARKEGIPLLLALGECPEASQWRYRQVRDFLWCIDTLRRESAYNPPADMVMRVREVTGYDAWLREEEGVEEGNDTDRLENLNALANAALRFRDLKEFLDYAEQVSRRNVEENGGDKVALMTIHKAKGLEFPVVFVAGLSNGLLPHRKAIQYQDGEIIPESIEEERRLCYVAMTRAKDRLYLSTIRQYLHKPLEQSVFLGNIWPERGEYHAAG
ncbi:MAG: ATP-dependent helicase [Moorellales bacterium]